MKTKNIFEITIEPLDDKNGNPDLDVCAKQLSHLEKAFKKTAEKFNSEKTIKFKITKMSKNSPLNAHITTDELDEEQANYLLSNIQSDLKSIQDNTISESIEYDVLKDYQQVSGYYFKKNSRHKASIKIGEETTVLDFNFNENISKFLSQNEICITSYEGELDQINVHNGINYFYIYPYSYPDKIKCNFPKELIDNAVEGIGRKVCITGKATYKKDKHFPSVIDVTGIDVYSNDDDLTDWNDLFGVAPDATGELLSEEFIANLRDEWN